MEMLGTRWVSTGRVAYVALVKLRTSLGAYLCGSFAMASVCVLDVGRVRYLYRQHPSAGLVFYFAQLLSYTSQL